MQIQEESLLECNCIGDIVFTDQENKNFYLEYRIDDLAVKIGDCVRLKLDFEVHGDDFAFGQVLAIYDDADEAFIEVRWFIKERELGAQHRKMYALSPLNLTYSFKFAYSHFQHIFRIEPQKNELVESCKLDDIPAVRFSTYCSNHFILRFTSSA